jgi:hypothetical protein
MYKTSLKQRRALKRYYAKYRIRILAARRKLYMTRRAKLLKYQQEYRKRNKARLKQKALKHKETRRINHRKWCGLPDPTRAVPLTCECCGSSPNKRSLNLDHDHVTGLFRGWLCDNCNTGIGRLGDSINGLLRAIKYLKGKIK